MSTMLQIDQMTLEEKLRAMEALWDDLCRHEEDVPMPHWHCETLDERERVIEQGQAHFRDWELAKKRINERTVFIHAVLDCRRDPAWIRKRLK